MAAMFSSLLYLFLLLAAAALLFSRAWGGDSFTPTQHLADEDGGFLLSDGLRFKLGFFSPVGSLSRYVGVWYNSIPVQTVVWVANRQRPITGRSGRLSLRTDGTLVITDNSTAVWSSTTPALSNPVARLLDDGNLVVTSQAAGGSNSFAWQSFDLPTDTILPGMKVGWDLTRGIDRNFTAWSTEADPSPSTYVSGMDIHGDPQLFLWSGTRRYWRGGPWNGVRFCGIPEMKAKNIDFEFTVNSREVAFSFYLLDPSIMSRLVTNSSGVIQHMLWLEERKSWIVVGFTPRDECDTISPCGPNGICYANREPMCTCIHGFHPKNSSSWNVGDWTDGCVRNTTLDCRNRTDGFLKLDSVKLPDTSRSTVDRSMSLDRCGSLCLGNCSCTAYASANISAVGSGCIIWTAELTDLRWYDSNSGQDLYVRMAASDLDGEPDFSGHGSRLLVIVLVPAVVGFLVAFGAGACCVCKRRMRGRYEYGGDEDHEVKDMDLPLYDLSTIVDATNNFSIINKLGQGGFGAVYKGKSGEEKEIAVKRLSKTSAQGIVEFKNEASLIAKLQHRNLVRLLGCCIQGGERMLIYEYMPNGSLDTFLFDQNKSLLLEWPTRYSIIVGISRGLLYLHQDSRFRIIHRDLKAANVLLDKDMNPKISDFGMARIFGGEESEVNTRRVVGTYGYMSPEYAMDGIFSVKSDVFSLGVLILEIVTCKKNRGVYQSELHQNLLGHVWSLWNEGKVLELVDTSIGGSSPNAQVLTCIKVGLLCVQERSTDRPTMSSVVKMLDNDSSLLPDPKKPGFVASKGPSNGNDSSTTKSVSSNADVSMTMLDGR